MATDLQLVNLRVNGKKKTRKITFINPNATGDDMKTFVLSLAGMTKNTIESAQKIERRDLSEYLIEGTPQDDRLIVGDECTVISGAGNDTLVLGNGISATIKDFSGDDCISLSSAVDFATFDGGVLSFGSTHIELENVDSIDDFYDMRIENGGTVTTLGYLIMSGFTNTAAENILYFDGIFDGGDDLSTLDAESIVYFNAIDDGALLQDSSSEGVNSYFDRIFA